MRRAIAEGIDYAALREPGHVFVCAALRDAEAIREAGYRAVVCAGWRLVDFVDTLIETKEYDERVDIGAGLIFAPPQGYETPSSAIITTLEDNGIIAYPPPQEAATVAIPYDLSVDYIDENGIYPFVQSCEVAYQMASIAADVKSVDYANESMGGLETQEAFGEYCRKRAGGGIKTGFPTLDSPAIGIGGLHAGLYVVGAASSTGKTSLVMQIAENVSAQGYGAIVVSLEMSKHTLRARGIARAAYINAHKVDENGRKVFYSNETIRYHDIVYGRANMSPDQWATYNAAEASYNRWTRNLWVYDANARRGVSVRTIDRIIGRYLTTGGNKKFIVVVDYLHLLRPLKIGQTDKHKVDEATSRLQSIAVKYDAPVIAVSAINRQSNYTSLTLDSFRESSSIGYSAEVAIGLQARGMFKSGCNEDKKNEGKALTDAAAEDNKRRCELVILKDREGKQSRRVVHNDSVTQYHVINLDFIPKYFHFEEGEQNK